MHPCPCSLPLASLCLQEHSDLKSQKQEDQDLFCYIYHILSYKPNVGSSDSGLEKKMKDINNYGRMQVNPLKKTEVPSSKWKTKSRGHSTVALEGLLSQRHDVYECPISLPDGCNRSHGNNFRCQLVLSRVYPLANKMKVHLLITTVHLVRDCPFCFPAIQQHLHQKYFTWWRA